MTDLNGLDLEVQLQRARKRKKKKRLTLIVILLAILALAGGLTWHFLNQPDYVEDYWFDDAAKDGILAGSDEDVQAILNAVVDKGMYNVSIKSEVIFTDGASPGKINIQNIPANHYYCQVTLKLEDGTEVYKSQGLKPGQYIEYVTLSQGLKKGNYPVTAVFTVTDPETFRNIATVKAGIQFFVLG